MIYIQFLKRVAIEAALIAGLTAVGCGDLPTSYREESRYERKQELALIYDGIRTNPAAAMNNIKKYVAEHGRDDLKDTDRQMLADGYNSEFLREPENRSPLQTPMGRYGMPVRTGTGNRPSRKPAASGDGLPLQSVTDVYTGEPVRAVLEIQDNGQSEFYWTPPVIRNDVRNKTAIAAAWIKERWNWNDGTPQPPTPRVRIDGNGMYYDVDNQKDIGYTYPLEQNDVQLVRTHTSKYGEDLMYAMRMVMGGEKRFEGEIKVYPYESLPPSDARGDSAAAGIMKWQTKTNKIARELGIQNPVKIRIIDSESDANIVVVHEGKTRGKGISLFGAYAFDETERDENRVPIKAYVYVNPIAMRSGDVFGVAAHEFGHAAIPMSGGNGPSPYSGGHLPYAGPNNDNLMAPILFVTEPSDFEALIFVTNYRIQNGWPGPYWTYSSEDFTTNPPPGSPDMDGNGTVDFDDFFKFADVFGTTAIEGDLNNDGIAGFDDFFLFADNFGKPASVLVTREQRMEYLNGTQ